MDGGAIRGTLHNNGGEEALDASGGIDMGGFQTIASLGTKFKVMPILTDEGWCAMAAAGLGGGATEYRVVGVPARQQGACHGFEY